MGKIIKFQPGNQTASQKGEKGFKKLENLSIDQKISEGIRDYILGNFAVKEILGLDFIYKTNDKKEVGVRGVIAYLHKRRPGTYIADFIGKGYFHPDGRVVIDLLAFRAGEPQVYGSLEKTMKAKNILPQEEK
ncbi:MAG: hypothetical protein GXO45_02850 [Aquificae bacterium]|nr:hypothetical protein [Aquificota bacterium]